jgi:hypothetical protein
MASNIKLTPFEYGEQFARGGQTFRFPYDNDDNNRLFKLGFDSYQHRRTGVPKGKEMSLP